MIFTTVSKILHHRTHLLTLEPIVIFETDCWFITNNKMDGEDQNIYIGIGEGYATNVGCGHVMQVHKTELH
ncbi:MAG: hypothetical protein IPP29_12610 [Bacteroidetes bacterium]|nr:hypothetical protein [Bacteroidota bacterium]